MVINCATGAYVTAEGRLSGMDKFQERFGDVAGYLHEIGGGLFVGGALPELIGHVDERDRALVRLPVPDQDNSVLALIDTGFNGHLFVQQEVAKQLGFARTGLVSEAEFADRGLHEVSLARGQIVLARCWKLMC